MRLVEDQNPRPRVTHAVKGGDCSANIPAGVLHDVADDLTTVRIGIMVHGWHKPEHAAVRGSIFKITHGENNVGLISGTVNYISDATLFDIRNLP